MTPKSEAFRAGNPTALEAVSAALAVAVPLLATALRVAVAPQWRDDVAVVSSLGFVPVGGEGAPSALLAQLFSLLPIGGRVLRAGLVGAAAAGLAGGCLHAIALGLLRANAVTPRLAPLLALAAALTATLSPTWQHEGTAAGGAALGAALGLAAFAALGRTRLVGASSGVVVGALLGLTLAESLLAGGAALVALTLAHAASDTPLRRQGVIAVAVTCASVVGFFFIPLLVRPFAEHSWMSLGRDLAPPARAAFEAVRVRPSPFSAWALEMGPAALALGIGGLAWGLWHRALRAPSLGFAALVLADAAAAGRARSVLTADPAAALGLLGVAGLAVGAVLGVQTASVALQRAKVPLAEPASVLLVVFHFTLVFSAAETTRDVVTPATGLGADVWTDEALGELPPGALLIVRSPELAWRLWAARVARGERPDVVVVPLSLLGRGSVAGDLVRAEPALAPLIRDVAMTGRTSEASLAVVADARPLFVELDPAWDKRLLDHLRPTPLWLGFVPHTLGRSDRTRALADSAGRRAFRRVLSAASSPIAGDPGTLAVLGARAREQAIVLAALGDKENARRALGDVSRIDPSSSFPARVEERLRSTARIDPRSLIE